MHIGITFPDNLPLHQVWGANGLSQNVKFLYDMLEDMGHEVFLMVSQREQEWLHIGGRTYRLRTRQELYDQQVKFDLALEAAISISQSDRRVFRETCGARIVSVRYGPVMFIDMEGLFISHTLPPDLHQGQPEVLWTSPHYIKTASYLGALYDAPVEICPYIWTPDFTPRHFSHEPMPNPPDIYVMEPNISVIKNCLIPLAILERLYRRAPESFGKAMVMNASNFAHKDFFLHNFVTNFRSLWVESQKIYFCDRFRIFEAFQRRDILLGFQHENELNYLYLEALYMGLPLVHNVASMQDAGFYYPEFDVDAGVEQLQRAIREFDPQQQRERADPVFYRYSPHNPEVRRRYTELLEQAMAMPVRG